MKKCPFCAEEIQDAAKVCKHCGRELQGEGRGAVTVAPKKKTGCVAGGCAVLLALIVLSALVRSCAPTSTTTNGALPPSTTSKEQLAAHAEKNEAARKAGLGSAVKVAQLFLAKPECGKDAKALAQAWTPLSSARKTDPEWADAVKAAAGLEQCRKKLEGTLAKSLQAARGQTRVDWAKQSERKLLDSGMDTTFTVGGAAKDQLTIKWALMGRVAMHKMTNGGSMDAGSFLANVQSAGFRRVDFTDGYNFFSNYYDLKPPSDATVAAGEAAVAMASNGLGAPLVLR